MAFPVILIVQGSHDAGRRLPARSLGWFGRSIEISAVGSALHAAHHGPGDVGGLCSSVDLVQTVFHRL
jgi:hypothetical protein